MEYDVIVVGAGTGGCFAAKAVAKAGLSVCLIDQKAKNFIGDKVCGEAVGVHHFKTLEISPPKGIELAGTVQGIDVYSPDSKTVFRVKGEDLHGFMVNRLELGQRFVDEAVDVNVTLLDDTRVLDPIIRNDAVCGVVIKKGSVGSKDECLSKIVIDASGMSAVVRKQLPAEWGFEREILDEDIEVCYQEIREISGVDEVQAGRWNALSG